MKRITFIFILLFVYYNGVSQEIAKRGNGLNNIITSSATNINNSKAPSFRSTDIFYEDFEVNDTLPAGWSVIDNDGDKRNWIVSAMFSHSGTQMIQSRSWAGTGIHPDNYLITPAITISASTGNPRLEWWRRSNENTAYDNEKYKVLVSTTGTNLTDFTDNLFEEVTVGQTYFELKTINLDNYIGQTIYIAFVHYDCTDQDFLGIDDVRVYDQQEYDAGVVAFTSPDNSSNCSLTATENITVTIRNYGVNPISNFPVSYVLNGNTVTETFTGTINSLENANYIFTTTEDLSNFDTYEFNAYTDLTNDGDNTNDAFDYSIVSSNAKIAIRLMTDNKANELHWWLTNSNGDTVATNGVMANMTQHDYSVCVFDDDCYQFELFDETGDGMTFQYQGWLKIYYNGDLVGEITASESNFGSSKKFYAIGDGCKQNDVDLLSLDFPAFSQPSTDININGKIKNIGSGIITSLDIDYTINGGASVGTYSVSNLNLQTGDVYNFTHDVVFNEATEAIYSVEVTVSQVNGGSDDDVSNNTLTRNINVSPDHTYKNVLIEQFTTENCGNCPPVLAYMETIFDNDPNVFILTHHSGYYTDFLTTPEDTLMVEFYNSSPFAPAGMFNRSYNGLDNDNSGAVDPGPLFWDGEPFAEERIKQIKDTPAFADVEVCGTYDASSKLIEVKVRGQIYSYLDNVGTSLWISEDSIAQQQQAQPLPGFIHRYTNRKVVSDRLGDLISTATTAGSAYEKSYTYYLNDSWEYNHLYLVGLINKINATDVNDREIINVAQVKLSEIPSCNVDVVNINKNMIKIYPNPSKGIINIEGAKNNKIEIYDGLGQIVKIINNASSSEIVDLSSYKNGTYIVKVINKNDAYFKKLIIIR